MVPHRIALTLDLENLLYAYQVLGTLEAGLKDLAKVIATYEQRGELVSRVGFCNRTLQRQAAFELSTVGVRVFGHREQRADAADHLLLSFIARDLPQSVNTVVIGSGDHIFAGSASSLREAGRRVEVLAPTRGLASELLRVADAAMAFGPVLPSEVRRSRLQPAA